MQSCVWEVRGSAFHHLSTAATFVASPLGAAYLSCVELSLEADIWAALSSGKEGREVEAMAGRRGGAAMVVVVCCYWGALLMGTAVADGNFLSLALYNFILRCSSLWEWSSGPRFRVTFVRLDVIACTISKPQ